MCQYKNIVLISFCTIMLSSCLTTGASVEDTSTMSVQELILAGKTNEVQSLFETPTDINLSDENGNTALHTAALVNNADIVNFLLFKGANSEIKNANGDTALHLALKNNGIESARLLAGIENNIFARDGNGKYAIEIALEQGALYYDVVLTNEIGIKQDVLGQSIVHYLVKFRDIEGINFAIANNIPLSIQDNNGNSPLLLAYSQKDADSIVIASKLILADAAPERGRYSFFEDSVKMRNPSLRLDEGQTPLHLAVILQEEYMVKYLISQNTSINAKDNSGSTALHEAVRTGNVNIITDLLVAGADVNVRDSLGKTPLLIIMPEENRLLIYELLLEYGANINSTDSFGDTSLHIAALSETNINVIEFLVSKGADINERNKKGITPLAQAVEKRVAEHIYFYATRGADIHAADINNVTPLYKALDAGIDMTSQLVNNRNIISRDSMGNTVLHIAVSRSASLDQIEFLVDMGSDVNARNRNGHTPLYLTVQANNRIIGEYLLSTGADVFYSDSDNSSPLRLAFEWGNEVQDWFLTSEVIKAIDGIGNTPLHYAAEWKLNNAVLAILEKGGNPNAQNSNGETPIFNAAKSNNIEAIQVLLRNGADKDLRNYLGNTIIHNCVRWNATDAARIAIRSGYNVNAQNLSGKTALHQAARSGQRAMVELLLDEGANIHSADTAGRTPLMDAILAQNIENVRILISRGANTTIPEMYGRNAYHEAVETENIELIKLISSTGANPLARDSHGRTPLSQAFEKDINLVRAVLSTDNHLTDSDGNTPLHIALINSTEFSIIQYLLQSGYSPDRRNSEGTTPLLLATKKGNSKVVEAFLANSADPFITDNSGESPLSYAIKHDATILNLIIQISGNRKDIAGETILHYAAREADYDTIQRLLSMGLDREIKNISGETAYDIAIRWDRADIARLLK